MDNASILLAGFAFLSINLAFSFLAWLYDEDIDKPMRDTLDSWFDQLQNKSFSDLLIDTLVSFSTHLESRWLKLLLYSMVSAIIGFAIIILLMNDPEKKLYFSKNSSFFLLPFFQFLVIVVINTYISLKFWRFSISIKRSQIARLAAYIGETLLTVFVGLTAYIYGNAYSILLQESDIYVSDIVSGIRSADAQIGALVVAIVFSGWISIILGTLILMVIMVRIFPVGVHLFVEKVIFRLTTNGKHILIQLGLFLSSITALLVYATRF